MDSKSSNLFILLLVMVTFVDSFNPYCHVQYCFNSSHTLCRFPIPVLAVRCGILLRHGLNAYEINRIVTLHNELRAKVYAGREFRGNPGPLPRAHYFRYLHWDNELAFAAQRWAEQCDYRTDKCRHFDRFLVGQLIGHEATFGDVEVLSVELPIQKWYNEVMKFNRSYIFNFNRDAVEMAGAEKFSQIIWQNTIKIGCGALRFFDGLYSRLMLVCNYAPRGNASGKPVYSVLGHRFNSDSSAENRIHVQPTEYL